MKKKIVLAYSGGLDTSFCAVYLSSEQNAEVHAVLVNTGAFDEKEIAAISEKATQMGVSTFNELKVENDYYQKCIKYLIYGNVLKNGTYPLSVSSERTVQALAIVAFARKIGATAIAHGSTGAGNDQIRFDLIFNTFAPEIEIITPIRDLKLSRNEEIDYLSKKGVTLQWKKMEYSINKGLWGTSIGGKETLTSSHALPNEAYPSQVTKEDGEVMTLGFVKGELLRVNGFIFEKPVSAIREVERIASAYAIGRDIHVGDTIVGIKGRVAFEAAAPLIIIKAHHALEKHVLTKWQLYWKEQLANWYGMLLHEAQYLDPVMRNIEKFMESSQEQVTGQVFVSMKPYRFDVNGVDSTNDLMNAKIASYGESTNGWTGDDVKGFTKILGMPISIYNQVHSNDISF